MATSKIQVCSNALILLGQSTIASFSESSDRATACSNLWDNSRQAVLRSHPWNCAMKRVALTPDANTPAFDWAYQFALPGDCLRVLSVGQDGEVPEYKLEGRKILIDDNPLYLRYIFDNDDVASWDTQLVECMTRYMAFSMAYALTKSASLRDSIYQEFTLLLKKAKAVDGQEDTPDEVGDFPFLAARR